MLTCFTCLSSLRSTRSTCSSSWTLSRSSRLSSWSSSRQEALLIYFFVAARLYVAQGELGDAHALHPLEQLELHALNMLEQLDLELFKPPKKLELRAPAGSLNLLFLSSRVRHWRKGSWGMLACCCFRLSSWSSPRSTCSSSWTSSC